MLFAVLSVAFGQSFNPLLVGAGALPTQNASPSPIKLFQSPSCRGGSAPTEEEYLMITVRFGFQSPFLSGRERSLTDDMVAASDDVVSFNPLLVGAGALPLSKSSPYCSTT